MLGWFSRGLSRTFRVCCWEYPVPGGTAWRASSSLAEHDNGAPFTATAYYLGSEVDIQKAEAGLSSRFVKRGKDFAVFSLGPESALSVAGGQEAVEHVTRFGVMVAFKFGSVVFFVPRAAKAERMAPVWQHSGSQAAAASTAPGSQQGQQQRQQQKLVSAAAAAAADEASTSGSDAGPPGRHRRQGQGASTAVSIPQQPSWGLAGPLLTNHRQSSEPQSKARQGFLRGPVVARSSHATVLHQALQADSIGTGPAEGEVASLSSEHGEDDEANDGVMAELKQQLKRAIREVVKDPVVTTPPKEEASMVLRPHMRPLFAKETDRMAIRELDLGNLEVICRVVGQSAALHFYTSKVGDSLKDFDMVLADMAENAGKPMWQQYFLFRRLRGGKLLSTIATNSIMYNKVVSKLGLLDTSRTAWESDGHDIVWKGLKREYELEQRFENLLKKLDIYKEESRFILEVRNERGSAAAEWIIIALIALEIVVNTYFHLAHPGPLSTWTWAWWS